MCKTGFAVRDDGVLCRGCGAASSVTPLMEKADGDGDMHYAICEICIQTGMEGLIEGGEANLPVLSNRRMMFCINRAINVAVEQISARMIEYMDSIQVRG